MVDLINRLSVRLTFRIVFAVTIVPLVAAALYIALTELAAIPALRYNPADFNPALDARYDSPSAVVEDLERALRTDDTHQLALLQGLRHPHAFTTGPNIRATILYNVSDDYYSYLFWDTRTYARYPYHIQQVNGRWVVAPQDALFYLRTGQWTSTWLPIALVWWVLEATILATVGVNALLKRWRRETYAY
jgi:hypothetical protein